MKVAVLTREYPPEVYGGAGVHVEYLTRELARLEDVTVHCWGAERPDADPPAVAYRHWPALDGAGAHLAALQAVSIDLAMAAGVEGVDVVHSHTWYTNLAGHLARLLYGVPHVATVHSLEPLRPWKAEQLGGGYALSSFCERTALEAADAIVAVSEGMRRDLLACYPAIDPARVEVIYNGVDTDEYRPDEGTDVLERYGIDLERPSVVFVGRITRQKGVTFLLEAAPGFDPEAQLVLCAGAPDTAEIGAEVEQRIRALQAERDGVVWLDQMLPKAEVVQLLSHATVFVCPSIYEPLGIVNLEAMACEAAVVATATGGIVEVVDDGVTGLLVPYDPAEPEEFVAGIATHVNELLRDRDRAQELGLAGRQACDRAVRVARDRRADGRALPRSQSGAQLIQAAPASYATDSRWLRSATPELRATIRFRIGTASGLRTRAIRAIVFDNLTYFAVRGARSRSYSRSACTGSPPRARQRATTIPSSIAWFAPCPSAFIIGCAASPISVTRPAPMLGAIGRE